jgi:hypothetical protein
VCLTRSPNQPPPAPQGFYDPLSALAFRAVAVKERCLDETLIGARLSRAVALRRTLFGGSNTTGACACVCDVLAYWCFKQTLPSKKTFPPSQATTHARTGYRLLNGEGDLLPGLVCDVYGTTAVLKLDGPGPAGFYSAAGIAELLAERLQLDAVFLKNK